MSPEGKIYIGLFFIVITCFFSISFYKIIIKKDYLVFAEIPCDISTQSCFIRDCNQDYERCTHDDKLIYTIIQKKAYRIPKCDPYLGECDHILKCKKGEPDCKIITCDPQNLSEDQTCVEK